MYAPPPPRPYKQQQPPQQQQHDEAPCHRRYFRKQGDEDYWVGSHSHLLQPIDLGNRTPANHDDLQRANLKLVYLWNVLPPVPIELLMKDVTRRQLDWLLQHDIVWKHFSFHITWCSIICDRQGYYHVGVGLSEHFSSGMYYPWIKLPHAYRETILLCFGYGQLPRMMPGSARTVTFRWENPVWPSSPTTTIISLTQSSPAIL